MQRQKLVLGSACMDVAVVPARAPAHGKRRVRDLCSSAHLSAQFDLNKTKVMKKNPEILSIIVDVRLILLIGVTIQCKVRVAPGTRVMNIRQKINK